MSVAKVIEINAASSTSIEEAVRLGVAKTAETVAGIRGVWVNEIKADVGEDGEISQWRVNLRITFVVN